ncbi:SBBP repeat-containing protein [bacterium SCSIO 12643]|nr:SBBP repeat-containing protein [bacterium SCSIO 12643]
MSMLNLSQLTAQSVAYEWAIGVGGSAWEEGNSIVVDDFGNVYTTGSYRGTVDFDPGTGVVNMTSNGSDDVFIQKLDSNGNFIWAKSIGGNSSDIGNSITVDSIGNVYVIGNFKDTVDFDPSIGVFDLISNGNIDCFILKLDVNGNFIWVKQIGGINLDKATSIIIDNQSNIYCSGYFRLTVDFDPGVAVSNLVSAGYSDVFVQKLDSNGDFLWAKRFGGTSGDFGYSMTVDDLGNVYSAGVFNGTVDFDPGIGTYNLTSIGNTDIFIQKLDANGDFLWAKRMGGIGYDVAYSIAVDIYGNVYSTGYFEWTVDMDPGIGVFNVISGGSDDVYVQKLDLNGNFVWAKSMGDGGFDVGRSIKVDSLGSSYILGYFSGAVDFDPGLDSTVLTSNGLRDIFIQKLDSNGSFLWAKNMGGLQYDEGNSITVDGIGNIYSTGVFRGVVDFAPGADTANIVSNGDYDFFVQKLSPCMPTYATDVQTACDFYTWIDGNVYTSSNNTAEFLLVNSVGCDSIVSLDLTIINSNSSTDTLFACDSIVWIDGNTYTYSNNTATYTLTNSVGCDSVVTLDLTILNSLTSDVIVACNSYTWLDGNTYTTSNNTATHTLTNVNGCDSVIILDLTIHHSNTGVDIISACDSYTWLDGNTYSSSNNTATYTLTNTNGCDSVVTLDLTIHHSNTGVDVISACDSYTWLDGNTYTSSNNTATYTLTNMNGCDSVVTLDLTINYPNSGIDVITACNSYTWIDGNTYTMSNNSATHTLINSKGCDSVITLNLTITKVSDLTVSVNQVTITSNNVNATYQWLDCDDNYSPISNETLMSFTATKNGNYAVELTENGCVDTSACVSITKVGIGELEPNVKLVVYPNPSSDIFNVVFEKQVSNVELKVTDVQGKLIYRKKIQNTSQAKIELNEAPGVYFLSIKTLRSQKTIQLLLE